jgi:hypothetical protein
MLARPVQHQAGAGKIPFIAFDLSGGANLNGSEILIGQRRQSDQLPLDRRLREARLAGQHDAGLRQAASPTNNFVNTEFGAAWHSDGRDPARHAGVDAGCHARQHERLSDRGPLENDTSNNPHNPMYGIIRVGADGQLLTLIGSQNSDSGGNSMAPRGHDESRRPPDQGRSRERRHGSRRHGASSARCSPTPTTPSRCSSP